VIVVAKPAVKSAAMGGRDQQNEAQTEQNGPPPSTETISQTWILAAESAVHGRVPLPRRAAGDQE
jgi:hypothetical protein